jgi:hypothetical protein
MSENKSLKEKLSFIQNELKAPKNQYNSFGKYKYRSCEDILEAVKPLCNKHRASLTICDEIQLVGERYYVMAVARLQDWDSDSVIHVTAYAREEENKKGMDASQVTGATSSYARKYALNGLFNIDDTKDSDTEEYQSKKATSTNKATTVKSEPAPSGDVTELATKVQGYYKTLNDEYKKVVRVSMKHLGASKLTELPADELQALVEIAENGKGTFGA